MSWKEATSINSVREEIRNAIFWTIFNIIVVRIDSREDDVKLGSSKAMGFTEFGVRAGLLTPEEGNDWLDAISEKKVLAHIAEKYMREGKVEDE